jgi:hypothetical protein
VVPALHLLENRNFVWLFDHMLLLVEYVVFVLICGEECIISNGDVGVFSFAGLCRP